MTNKEPVDPRALLEGTTPGTWEILGGANSHCFDLRITAGGKCLAFADGEVLDEDVVEPSPDAHLMAAAPQLALTCISQEERIAELEGALRNLLAETELTYGTMLRDRQDEARTALTNTGEVA